jgi:hypothetical protein
MFSFNFIHLTCYLALGEGNAHFKRLAGPERIPKSGILMHYTAKVGIFNTPVFFWLNRLNAILYFSTIYPFPPINERSARIGNQKSV